MPERIMLKAVLDGEYIVLRTVTESGRKSTRFYISRSKLAKLQNNYIIVKDSSFAEFFPNTSNDTMEIMFYWTKYNGFEEFTGYTQRLNINYSAFMDFITAGTGEFKAMSMQESFSPKITFDSRRNLHEVATDKLLRRKLSKFLRDNFKWTSSEIKLYDDFVQSGIICRLMLP